MSFFKRYPMMRPYVGKDFGADGKPSLLLLGESHYLEEESPQRMNPGAWYSGSSATLTDDQIEYISTAQLLEDSRADGFSNKSHSIWSNSLWEINEYGPGYSDYKQVADDIAFYNFFLRPGIDGDSLDVCPEDVVAANDELLLVCDELKPSAIVFLSMLARDCLTVSLPIPTVATPHPGCAWWNKEAAKYGNKKGRDLLADFVKTKKWK